MSEQLRWSPAWYSDPTGRHDHRWWDGEAWTDHVADAGQASRDALDAPTTDAPASSPSLAPAASRPDVATDVGPADDTLPVVGLILAIVALLVAFVPFLGLLVALPAFGLALAARRRARRRGLRSSGPASGALVLSSIALALALLTSVTGFALLRSSGGELTEAFRAYVECLETRSQAECRVLLEETLDRVNR